MPTEFLSCGDTAVVVQFGENVDAEVNRRVMGLDASVRRRGMAGVVETVPTFRSLMIHYDPRRTSRATLISEVEPLLENDEEVVASPARWTLPACYEGAFAPDLEDVAARTGLVPERVVALHSAATYRVYMIGFLPGFPYMGDLPRELELPRREEPRTQVPAGSIAIATTQTVVYPCESPGGWHLIGRTPVPMFSLSRPQPVLFKPGDEVRFEPIGAAEYADIQARIQAGLHTIVPDQELHV
jgi:inhibitor of KinA